MDWNKLGRLVVVSVLGLAGFARGEGLKTFDGRHSIEKIRVTMVYFVPSDRKILPDWKERLGYFERRIEQFHEREFQGQSKLDAVVRAEPYRSRSTTAQLREGDANAIFFKTLREVSRGLSFGRKKGDDTFPILLVLSDINWKPLDDFYRLRPGKNGPEFEGNYSDGRHHPGAESGGARAVYLADRGIGWGLVSGDGWRVPYRGSDCVVYHEGVGHTIGLPHPEPGDDSVMSLAQYRGWISESFLDRPQKETHGWKESKTGPVGSRVDDPADLFRRFLAIPDPAVPKPKTAPGLALSWPKDARVKSLRLRYQTDIFGPWAEVPVKDLSTPPARVNFPVFERPTPVSYRIDAELADGRKAELWGYFQVRETPGRPPQPAKPTQDLPALR